MTRPPWLFSGSGAERALACPASTVLPRVERLVGDAAREGTAVHAFLELCSELGDSDAALAKIGSSERWRDHLELCEAIDVSALPTELAHEVAFAFDLETGQARELGRGIGRNYAAHGLKRYEIPLTVDVVGISADAVFVGDYKTGRLRVTRALHNVQVGLGALCAARCYDRDHAIVEIIQPGRDGAKPYRDRAELDGFDLDDLSARLRAWPRRYAAARNASPVPVTTGPHCRWCDSYVHCPAQTALAIRVGTGAEIAEMQAELTRETAGRVYLRAKAAKIFLQRIFDAIHGMAEQEPIEFAPGQWLGVREKRGNEKLDGPATREVIRLLHDDEIADAAVEYTATKAGIRRALRGKVKPLEPAIAEIVEHVRAAGKATRQISTRITEYVDD